MLNFMKEKIENTLVKGQVVLATALRPVANLKAESGDVEKETTTKASKLIITVIGLVIMVTLVLLLVKYWVKVHAAITSKLDSLSDAAGI